MKYTEASPSPRFARNIKCFWTIEAEPYPAARFEPVLPDGCPEIVFNLGDRFERLRVSGEIETQGAAIVSGQIKRNILIRPTGKVELFGVRFHPSGAAPILGIPLFELTGHVNDLDSIFFNQAELLLEKIAEAKSFAARMATFEGYLAASLKANRLFDAVADAGCELILRSAGRKSIGRIAADLNVAERRLERKFKHSVGVSPKTFSRIVRFQNVIRHINAAPAFDPLDAALSFGYFDQSHMIRDFNDFAGQSPLAFFEETHRISELFTASV